MIVVEDYNANWAAWYSWLHEKIWPSVSPWAVTMEHVGSTAVPGLAAKPVIDLDIVVASPRSLPDVTHALARLGYAARGDLGIVGREAFHSPPHEFSHHLYVCIEGCTALMNHRYLRDHLRSSPPDVEAYSALKRRLANSFPDSIENYVEGKTQFILSILAQYPLAKDELRLIEAANRAGGENR